MRNKALLLNRQQTEDFRLGAGATHKLVVLRRPRSDWHRRIVQVELDPFEPRERHQTHGSGCAPLKHWMSELKAEKCACKRGWATPSWRRLLLFLITSVTFAVSPGMSYAQLGYNLSVSPLTPASVNAFTATSPTATVTITPLNGYNGTVNLNCTVIGRPQGSTGPNCTIAPASLTVDDMSTTSVLTVTTTSQTGPGTYPISVTGVDPYANNLPPSNGAQITDLFVTPLTPSYTLSASALTPVPVNPGGAVTSTVTMTPVNGYHGTVTVFCTVTTPGGSGPFCKFTPATSPFSTQLTVNSPTSTLTVSTTSQTGIGTYSILVTGVDTNANNLPPSNGAQSLALVVTPPLTPTYRLTVSPLTPASINQLAAASAASNVTITPVNGYTGSVSVHCLVIGQPPGLAGPDCSPPAPLTVGSGPAVSTLTVSTTSQTGCGTYPIQVNGVDGGGRPPSNGTQNLALNVVPLASEAMQGGVQNVSLVREQSSAPVYLIVGNTKFWITDPAEFQTLGFDWAKVHVVADCSLSRFTQQLLHSNVSTRPSDVFFDCGGHPAADNCKLSRSMVRKDVLVAGWLHDPDKEAPYVNSNGKQLGIEDIHYNLVLDANFLYRMYGAGGLSMALSTAVWPGNPPTNPLRLATDPPLVQGGINGVPFSSWILPCSSDELHGELNAWHRDGIGGWQGSGQPPAGWINPLTQGPNADPNSWFPFNPLDPEGTGVNLQKGDYIVMRGTIWQETMHSGCNPDPGWGISLAGISEMHPPDWIVRTRQPNPDARLTTGRTDSGCLSTALAGAGVPLSGLPVTCGLVIGGNSIWPDFAPSSPTKKLQVRTLPGVKGAAKLLIDSNFSNMTSLVGVKETPHQDHVDEEPTIQPNCCPRAQFKASWLVGWAEVDKSDQVDPVTGRAWVDDQVPTGAAPLGDEVWDWRADNVFTGKLSHTSTLATGTHQHYFIGASAPLQVNYLGTLFAMVFLDPDNPPDEVMLQWHSAAGWVRAYWGANLIPWGTNGTPDRAYMGPLPPTGEWVRLEVPAQTIGMNSGSNTLSMDGMAFTLYGGRAVWDYAGVNTGQVLPIQQ